MDLKELQTNIEGAVTGNGKSAIGTTSKDLTGVSPMEAGIQRSPCSALKWLDDNTPYDFQTFVNLTAHEGTQGIRAFNKNGKQVAEISVPIHGGEDGDPMKIIYQNNRAIIGETIKHVVSLQD